MSLVTGILATIPFFNRSRAKQIFLLLFISALLFLRLYVHRRGRLSGESVLIPPLWPRCYSDPVSYVGRVRCWILPCSKDFSARGFFGFPPSTKTKLFSSNSTRIEQFYLWHYMYLCNFLGDQTIVFFTETKLNFMTNVSSGRQT